DLISNAILTAARKCLLKRKVSNTIGNKKRKEVNLSKTLMQLGRWFSIEKTNLRLNLLEENIEELNIEIDYINQWHGTYIEKAQG
ncbi:15780_t:CDS:1, partial [Gigaspora rosea]